MNILFLKHKDIDYWDSFTDDINLFKKFYTDNGIPFDITIKEFDEPLEYFGYNNGAAVGLSLEMMNKLCQNYSGYQGIYICYKPTETTGGVFTTYPFMLMNGAIVSCIPASKIDADRSDNELFRILRHESIHQGYGMLNLMSKIKIADYLDRDCQAKLTECQKNGIPYTQAVVESVENIHWSVLMNYKSYLLKLGDNAVLVGLLMQLVEKLKLLLAELKKKQAPSNTSNSVVDRLAEAIAKFEGFYVDGSIAQRNRNPGNLVWSKYMDCVKDGFAHFSTVELGWQGLKFQLQLALSGQSAVYKPTMTIQEFVNVYASTSTEEERFNYAIFIANTFNTIKEMQIGNL